MVRSLADEVLQKLSDSRRRGTATGEGDSWNEARGVRVIPAGRGGRVSGNESRGGGLTVVDCEVPLREVVNYSRTLSSVTGGMGSFDMHFSHYEPMPARQQSELVAAK